METLSGGTTGQPRRIRRTQASWIASFAVNAGLFGIGTGARVAVAGQLRHSLALYAAIEGLHLGAEVHLLSGLRPDRLAIALAGRGVTHLYATPAQLLALTEAAPQARWPALAHLIVGGARLDPALRAVLAFMAPAAAIAEFYGAAETSFLTLSDPETGRATAAGATGRPYPGVDLRVGADGLIFARSPYLALGYAGAAGSAIWRDGWVAPGETGWIGPDGALHLTGRAGRIIRIAEQTLHPEEMEAALTGNPGIRRAAVLPRPDARRGAVPVAVLQGDSSQEAAILARLRAEFGAMRSPRAVIWWRGDWPVLASGKTDLQALAQVVAEGRG